ncbi:NADH:flavin oxidoreductase/NADH oxidase [Neisseriaceae bacterium ESL0693]|nr:NADH:flavin oxidoreductase/NADH oxidase [Neisseriaceae bacterium ESL0693]
MIHLFEPWHIGQLKLENRIVIPPMCQYSAENGCMTDWHRIHIGSMLTSGAGLFIIEATAVAPEGRISPYCVGLWSDDTAKAMQAVLTSVRRYSAMPVAIQLSHAGRKASTNAPWLGEDGGDRSIAPDQPSGWQTLAPSALPFFPDGTPPKAMTEHDIDRVVQDFAQAARRAEALGIDGIELHMAHGYLMHEFLSPLSNQRTDDYGGSLTNRMRLPLQVFKAVKAAVAADFPVWVRISATDWIEGGWDLAQSISLCRELKQLGCPLIHVSTGGLALEQNISAGPGYQVSFSDAIRKAVGIDTIAVGLINEPEQAESILVSQQADAIAVGRGLLHNPHWPWRAAEKLNRQISTAPQYWRGTTHPNQKNLFKK